MEKMECYVLLPSSRLLKFVRNTHTHTHIYIYIYIYSLCFPTMAGKMLAMELDTIFDRNGKLSVSADQFDEDHMPTNIKEFVSANIFRLWWNSFQHQEVNIP